MAKLAKQVCDILNDPLLGKLMNYSICGVTIRSSMLTDVAKAITKGQVTVVPSDPGFASGYDPGTDIFKIEQPLITYSDKGVVVHEALHCAQDIRGMYMVRIFDETAAYVGQGIYLRTLDPRFKDGATLTSDGSELLNMVEKLLPVVDLVMGGSKVPEEQLTELQDLICLIPRYENCRQTMIYHNGLTNV